MSQELKNKGKDEVLAFQFSCFMDLDCTTFIPQNLKETPKKHLVAY